MDNETVISIAAIVMLLVMIWHAEQRYRHGIWDGAFNQFLPRVQDAMREYDPRRAEEILGPKQEDGDV